MRKKLELDAEVLKLYQLGKSSPEIAKELNICIRSVAKIRSKLGYSAKTGQPRKYSINEKFFRTWTSDMAYILGIIATDGYIFLNTVGIVQKQHN
jgi:orotate phosphoribosyltransferase-like protein